MANGMPGTLISKHIKHQLLKLKIKNKLLKQIYLKNNKWKIENEKKEG